MENLLTTKAGLDKKQEELLVRLLDTMNNDQKLWLGGYLSGLNESTKALLTLFNGHSGLATLPGTEAESAKSLVSVFFGTRSGNAQKLANKIKRQAGSLGLGTTLVDLNEYNPKKIKKEEHILVIISTDGEGEPPVAAEEFYSYLMGSKAPEIKDLKFSVIALGDKTYTHYCKIGRDIDARLEELGAQRYFNRLDCDVDFEEDSEEWITNYLEKLSAETPSNIKSVGIHAATGSQLIVGSKESPYNANLETKLLLNGRGSTKSTWHLEFSLEDSGVSFTPGDSLGVITKNSEELVDEILHHTGLKADENVQVSKKEKSLKEALINDLEISTLVPQVLSKYIELNNNKKLKELIENQQQLEEYVYKNDVLDLISDFKAEYSAQQFVDTLRKFQPRLYSIASSYNANPDEVHLTVAQVLYKHNKRLHKGVTSNFLADLEEDTEVPIYIDENLGFRLPDDTSAPIVMIGAGTGVAPYRAFLQERSLAGTVGENWLFFGDRNFATDFLYQTDWQKFLKQGVLNRFDVAFSRDQKEKIYVQDKLYQHRKEIYHWLIDGAYFYLCGDKDNMAKDVKNTLLKIIQEESGYSIEKSEELFRKIRKEKRFQEDVY